MAAKDEFDFDPRPHAHRVSAHRFSDAGEVRQLQDALLAWYEANQRALPWRVPFARRNAATPPPTPTKEQRAQLAYRVWVSEIMLQQTRVDTVVEYFNKWVDRWPDVEALAAASLEDVNCVWAGLGYYRRARFLHEAAIDLVARHNGKLPATAKGLLKVKGIGRYTAGAVASIAHGEGVPAVDGNVIRVLTRLRGIGGLVTAKATTELLWDVAGEIVDHEHPGDFNQALMELGATVCTPTQPKCAQCPVRAHCRAFQVVSAQKPAGVGESKSVAPQRERRHVALRYDGDESEKDREEGCDVCRGSTIAAFDSVTVFPAKEAKAKARKESALAVVAVVRSGKGPGDEGNGESARVLVTKPPGSAGLLAGLWDVPFVSVVVGEEQAEGEGDDAARLLDAAMLEELQRLGLSSSESKAPRTCAGEFTHLFTHIRQTVRVEVLEVGTDARGRRAGQARPPKGDEGDAGDAEVRWVEISEVQRKEVAVSKRALKCLEAFQNPSAPKPKPKPSRSLLDMFAVGGREGKGTGKGGEGKGKGKGGEGKGGEGKRKRDGGGVKAKEPPKRRRPSAKDKVVSPSEAPPVQSGGPPQVVVDLT